MEVKLFLYADPKCWNFREANPEEWDGYGCGPGKWGDYLVPDTMWGLYIGECCRIHDWGYRHDPEASEENRASHDRILKNNCIRIIDYNYDIRMVTSPKFQKLWEWLKEKRYKRAELYYDMVRSRGGPSYWEERNPDTHYKEV